MNLFRERMAQHMDLDRRVRKVRRIIWNWTDAVGEIVVVLMGLLICICVAALFWAAFAAIESWLR
jgi:hypothetical protein